jgi:hypothetical protein
MALSLFMVSCGAVIYDLQGSQYALFMAFLSPLQFTGRRPDAKCITLDPSSAVAFPPRGEEVENRDFT